MTMVLSCVVNHREIRWVIRPGVTRVGRDPGSDVWVQDESVSRKHAEITLDDGGAVIRDLGSRNGTTVNGVPVTPGSPQAVQEGDLVALGAMSLTVTRDPADAEETHEREIVGFADDALRGAPVAPGRERASTDAARDGAPAGAGREGASAGTGRDGGMPGPDAVSGGHAWVESSLSRNPAGMHSGSGRPAQGSDRIASGSGRGIPSPDDSGLSTTRMSWQDIRAEIGTRSNQTQNLLSVLLEAGQMLVLPQSLTELYETSIELVSRLFPADRILLLLRNGDSDDLQVCGSRGIDPNADPTTFLSRSILRAVLEDHESLLLRDPRSDPRFVGSDSIIALRLRSTMTVPLFDNEMVIGLLHADTTSPFQSYDEDQLKTLALLGNLVAVKIKNARLLDELRVKARLEQEMETAAQIQRRLLPDHLPRLENYRLAARLLPCLETAGDFFDIGERADGAVEVLIGDVSGKGVGAALLMSHTVAAYRVLSQEGHALSELMDRLCCHVYASSDATRFVTLFASRLDLEKHELRYVNGGHSPVLIVHADGSCDRLPATGPAVGLIDGCSFEEQRLPLGPGSVVCFYTDGIIEAGQDDPYEEERLRAVLERSRDLSPEQIIDAILEDVHRHTGRSERDDDITVVVLKRVS